MHPPKKSSNMRLLVVTHDVPMQGLIREQLEPHGWQITAVTQGADAIRAYTAARPSVVLLDMELPDIDACDLCAQVKSMPRGARVPVLMRATAVDDDLLVRAYEAGAHDFLMLPEDLVQLPHNMRYLLRASQSAESAQRAQAQLERAQEMAKLGNWLLAADGGQMQVSRALASMIGLKLEEGECRPDAFIDRIHPEDRTSVRRSREASLAKGVGYRLSYRVVTDDIVRSMSETAQPVFDEDGHVAALEGITQDITEKVAAQKTISYLSHHHPATGLPNHAYFLDLCEQGFDRASRAGASCAVIHVELDRYEAIHSALGDARTAAVLRIVAQRIAESIRDAGPSEGYTDATLAQVSAGAFGVLLAGIGGTAQLQSLSERILKEIAKPVVLDDTEVVTSAASGIAMYPKDSRDPKTLSLYSRQAHQSGRSDGHGSTRFYDAGMSSAARERLSREAELRHAIANGQMRLAYQPKVDSVSGRIVGAEALVRWMHPQRGLLGPDQFIALAEETGLIAPLTEWVLDTACADIAARQQRGLMSVPVSMNFASANFRTSGDLQQLMSALERHALSPDRLMLEVTEALLMKDTELAIRRVRDLREAGFKLSLDDFGTGFSALSHFKLFQVDEIKIDRSFVAEAAHGGRDAGIVCAITALGREFGLDVCAEGVETHEQAEFLRLIGCNLHQGRLYAMPMQSMDFEALLQKAAEDRLPWKYADSTRTNTIAFLTRPLTEHHRAL